MGAPYFILSNRITNGLLAALTTPALRIPRLRFLDFFVRMWRLKAFWWVISPVPVTLKRFFALELVLTFGIFVQFTFTPLPASRTDGSLWSHVGNMFNNIHSDQHKISERAAKVRIILLFDYFIVAMINCFIVELLRRNNELTNWLINQLTK